MPNRKPPVPIRAAVLLAAIIAATVVIFHKQASTVSRSVSNSTGAVNKGGTQINNGGNGTVINNSPGAVFLGITYNNGTNFPTEPNHVQFQVFFNDRTLQDSSLIILPKNKQMRISVDNTNTAAAEQVQVSFSAPLKDDEIVVPPGWVQRGGVVVINHIMREDNGMRTWTWENHGMMFPQFSDFTPSPLSLGENASPMFSLFEVIDMGWGVQVQNMHVHLRTRVKWFPALIQVSSEKSYQRFSVILALEPPPDEDK